MPTMCFPNLVWSWKPLPLVPRHRRLAHPTLNVRGLRTHRPETIRHARRLITRPIRAENIYGLPEWRSGTAVYSTAIQQSDLLERYRGLVSAGKIRYDEEQVRVVMQLRRLQKELIDYSPAMIAPQLLDNPETSSAWWKDDTKWGESADPSELQAIVPLSGHAQELAELKSPKGLMLTGQPGSGKSFLVDLWLSGIPTPYKTRKHYNQLVLEIYRGVWEETKQRISDTNLHSKPHESEHEPWNGTVRDRWRHLVRKGSLPLLWRRNSMASSRSTPTIAFAVARKLLLRHWLLVFDEVQLLDISSALLIADVLTWYWRMGGVIVGTSNKVPDDIYQHGVQRERLEPFVEALKARCPVLTMRTEHDWRQQDYNGVDDVGRTWLSSSQENQFSSLLESFAGDASEERDKTLNVFGRAIPIPWAQGGVCRFTFYELCDASLGPADYLTLAAHFHTVGISNIPVLRLSDKNQARRFISLIDALYEARCRLVCSAETKPEDIFFPDAARKEDLDTMMAESVSETEDRFRPNVTAYDSSTISSSFDSPSKKLVLDTLSIFSGKEEQFAFKRALSRLIEMTSANYPRNTSWTPLADQDRVWERSVPSNPNSNIRLRNRSDDSEPFDFAPEAAYVTSKEGQMRPPAPKLKAHHAWGVRDDWGKGTNDWGLGAKVYEDRSEQKRRPDP